MRQNLKFKKGFYEILTLMIFIAIFFIMMNTDVSFGVVQQEIALVDQMANEAAAAAQQELIGYYTDSSFNTMGISAGVAEGNARNKANERINELYAQYHLPGSIEGPVSLSVDTSNMVMTLTLRYRTGDIWTHQAIDDKLTFDKTFRTIVLNKSVVKQIENPKYYRIND